jgi:hypothetical protein
MDVTSRWIRIRWVVRILIFLTVVLFASIIAVLAQEDASIFHAKCPICGYEAIQPSVSAEFTTNGIVASQPGGRTVITRTVKMTCRNVGCGVVFQAQADYWVPPVIATEVKIPAQTRKKMQEMGLPPLPSVPLLVRTNQTIVIAPVGRTIVARHLATMTADELISAYNTNSSGLWLVEILPTHER